MTAAATLMTGDRGGNAARDLAAMRDSGLAHLLAISGLHIGLIAAILFFTVRGLLALAPRVALNYPIKKWAAAAAMLGAFACLLITGLTIPTQRAFLMTSIVLLAVILDRSVISMGLVAWAAAVVLLLSPESLLGPSFQMSFAAVVALIAAYEVCRAPMIDWLGGGGIGRRVLLYFMGIGLTTLVAGLATTPFAIFHFNRFVAFGLAANLVAVPVMALWIMPWAMLAYVLMPFGLERLALVPMGTGIDLVLGVAHTVAAWPGAVWLLPPMPTVGLVLVALGGLWLCLWRRAWRFAGIAGIAMGFATIALERPPDVLVDGAGRLLGVRADGGLMISSSRVARITASQWLRHTGYAAAAAWPANGRAIGGLRCDAVGCIYRSGSHVVALVKDPRALAEDCGAATVVVSILQVRGRCPSAQTVIDRFDLWREGAHAIWLGADGVRTRSVAAHQGKRPWAPRRPARAR